MFIVSVQGSLFVVELTGGRYVFNGLRIVGFARFPFVFRYFVWCSLCVEGFPYVLNGFVLSLLLPIKI